MIRLLALYGHPEDPTAFDHHYRKAHIPLVKRMPHLRHFEVSRSVSVPGDEQSPYYLVAEMVYESEEDLRESLASQAGTDAVEDVATFATGGVTVLVASMEEVD
jgi:uncharacterized protein (TIGR02118 family)